MAEGLSLASCNLQMTAPALIRFAGLPTKQPYGLSRARPDSNPAWLTAPKAVLLPHLGSATQETREAMARLLCDGIVKALAC